MHYMNGREANNGDSIVHIRPYDKMPTAGVLYNAKAGNDYCNGMVAPFNGGTHFCPNLKECLRLDDFSAFLPTEWPGPPPRDTP
mgnify:CR=1 FL=1